MFKGLSLQFNAVPPAVYSFIVGRQVHLQRKKRNLGFLGSMLKRLCSGPNGGGRRKRCNQYQLEPHTICS